MNRFDAYKILRCAEETHLSVRRALQEDVMDILRWRNEPHVCAMSRQHEPINETVHHTWYSRALNDPDKLLLIGTLLGIKVGIVRFEKRRALLWEVNITLATEARGRRLARPVLEMALDCLHADHAQTDVLAVVMSDNEQSLRLFRLAGFIQESKDEKSVSLFLPSNSKE